MVAPLVGIGLGAGLGLLGGMAAGDGGRSAFAHQRNKRNQDLDDLITMLRGQAAGGGQGGGITGMQLQQALQQSRAQQESMAAGARPGQQAAAMRMAMQNQSALGTQAAGQAALARLQEQMAARQLLSQAILQGRGQDTQGLATFTGQPNQAQRIIGGISSGAQLGAMTGGGGGG